MIECNYFAKRLRYFFKPSVYMGTLEDAQYMLTEIDEAQKESIRQGKHLVLELDETHLSCHGRKAIFRGDPIDFTHFPTFEIMMKARKITFTDRDGNVTVLKEMVG